MSVASRYAERYKQAVEVETAAQRAKDGVQKVQFLLPPEVPDQAFGCPRPDRLVARVTTEGKFAYEGGHRLTAPEALKLASWILETFSEPGPPAVRGGGLTVRHAREKDQWMNGLHHHDCAIWRLAQGDCDCGGLKWNREKA